MNSVEERLREALRAHAEEFTAHPDAWRQLAARRQRRGGPRWRRSRFPGPVLIPVAAAVAVVAVIAAALMVVHGVSGRSGQAPATGATATPRPASPSASRAGAQTPGGPRSAAGPDQQLLTMDPPRSAVVYVRVPGIQKKVDGKAEQVTSYFWRGRNNLASWPDQVNPGLQLCNDTVNDTTGQSSGFCWPAPAPGPGHLASVTGSEGVGTDQTIMVGEAASRVASVTAVLPDGSTYRGALSKHAITATAYDKAGHVLGQVRLGQMP